MYLLLQDQELIEITFKKTVLDNPIFLKFAFCKRFCYLMGYFPVVLQNLMDSPFIINFKPHRNNHPVSYTHLEIGSYIAGNGGYMSNTNDAGGSKDIPDNFPAEDLVLKSAMQFFGDELLSYLKITAEPV